jgi:Tfp pilus assembly protein PilF
MKHKKIKYIKRNSANKTPDEIAKKSSFSILDAILNWGLVIILFIAPFIYIKGLNDFSNLPQNAFIQISVVFLLLVWLIKCLKTGKCTLLKSPFNLPILGFLLCCLISALYAHNQYEGFMTLMHWTASALMFFLVINNLGSIKDSSRLLTVAFLAGFLAALVGISQYLFGFSAIPQIMPPAVTFGNRNMAVHFIILTLPLAAGFFFKNTQKIGDWIIAIISSFMIVFLIYTKTRAGWLALSIELILLSGLLFNFKRKNLNRILYLVLALMAVFWTYIFIRSGWLALGIALIFLFAFLVRERLSKDNTLGWNNNKVLALGGALLIILMMLQLKIQYAWLALLIFLFAFILMKRLNNILGWHKIVAAGTVLLVMVVVSQYDFKPIFKDQIIASKMADITKLINNKETLWEQETISIAIITRLAIARNSLEMIKDKPLIGFGLGNHKVFYPIYHRKAVKDRGFTEQTQLKYVHNDYIQIAAEVGIIGIFFLGWLGFAIFKVAFSLMSSAYSRNIRFWTLGILLGITGLMVNAFFSFPFQRAIPPFILMAFIGILGFFYADKSRQIDYKVHHKWILISACALVFAGLIGLVRFHYLDIKCDRHLLRAIQMEKGKNWQGALAESKKAYYYNPNRTMILFYVGHAYTELGNYKKGIEALSKLVAAYPYNMNALLNMGALYARLGDYDQAIKAYNKVLQIKPDHANAHQNIGHLFKRQGKINKALKEFQIAAELEPENSVVHFNIGVAQWQNKRYKEAAESFKKAVGLNPEWDMAQKFLGIMYFDFLNEPEKGIVHLKRALELNPKTKGADQILNRINRF